MEQFELFPLPSPCIDICEANNRGYCKGCLRNRSERQQWFSLNNLEKRHILHLCQMRRQKLQQLAGKQQKDIPLPQQLDFGF